MGNNCSDPKDKLLMTDNSAVSTRHQSVARNRPIRRTKQVTLSQRDRILAQLKLAQRVCERTKYRSLQDDRIKYWKSRLIESEEIDRIEDVSELQKLFSDRPELRAKEVIYDDDAWKNISKISGKNMLDEARDTLDEDTVPVYDAVFGEENESGGSSVRDRLCSLLFADIVLFDIHILPMLSQIEGSSPEDFGEDNTTFTQVDEIMSMLNSEEMWRMLTLQTNNESGAYPIDLNYILREGTSVSSIHDDLYILTKPAYREWVVNHRIIDSTQGLEILNNLHHVKAEAILSGIQTRFVDMDMKDSCAIKSLAIIFSSLFTRVTNRISRAKTKQDQVTANNLAKSIDYSSMPIENRIPGPPEALVKWIYG